MPPPATRTAPAVRRCSGFGVTAGLQGRRERRPGVACAARDPLQRRVERVRRARRMQPVDDAGRFHLLAGRAEAQHRAPHQFADANAQVFGGGGDRAFLRGRDEYDDAFAGLVHGRLAYLLALAVQGVHLAYAVARVGDDSRAESII